MLKLGDGLDEACVLPPGERIELGGLAFTVLDSDARKVERVEITRLTAHDAAE